VFNVAEAEIIIPRKVSADVPAAYIFRSLNNRYNDIATPAYWRDSFGRKFSEITAPTGVRGKAKHIEYDVTPEIKPTAPEVLDENIKSLLREMRGGGLENGGI
jgi:hypothetical protein